MDDDSVCAVCQHPFDDVTPTATTPCSHRFHSSCFLSAALTSDSCPVCRMTLYPEEESSEGDDTEIGSGVREDIVSRLANARLRLDDDLDLDGEDIVIEINEPPNLRRGRLVYTVFKACKEGNLAEVRRLIEGNLDLALATAENQVCDTLLHQAVFPGDGLLLRYLVNEVGVPVNSTNNYRMTPLHYAVSSGVEVTNFMLNSGAYVDAQDSAGKTPLMSACGYNSVDVAKLLVDRGASMRHFDAAGDTCLHYAARGKCLGVLRYLLRHAQVEPNSSNFIDETPLHLACATGSFTAVRFLLESGADARNRTKSGKKPVEFVPRGLARLPLLLAEHT